MDFLNVLFNLVFGPFTFLILMVLFLIWQAWKMLPSKRQKNASSGGGFSTFWRGLLVVLLLSVLMALPALGGPGFALLALIILLISLIPGDERRFFKYQQNLPTSKIRSLAMGIVELQGRARAVKTLTAPLSGRRCIGYRHTIHEEERDDDGDKRYRLIHKEERCLPFVLEDDTGEVQVDAKGLGLYVLPVFKEQQSGDRVAREYVLEHGAEYLLVGKAVRRGSGVGIVRDNIRRVFGIAPVGHLKRRVKLNAQLAVWYGYTAAIAIVAALILVLPLEVVHGKLLIHYADWPPYRYLFNAADAGQGSVDLPASIATLVTTPGYMLVLGIFGAIPALVLFATTMRIPPLARLSKMCAGTVAVSFPASFVGMIVMQLAGFDGIYLFLCWAILHIGYAVFVVLNYRQLAAVMNDYNRDDPPLRKRPPVRRRKR